VAFARAASAFSLGRAKVEAEWFQCFLGDALIYPHVRQGVQNYCW